MTEGFFRDGWALFPPEPEVSRWAGAAAVRAAEAVADPALRKAWLRCGGTWFAGVNALGADEGGAVAGGPPLVGAALGFLEAEGGFGRLALDAGQVSVCWPGYPRPWAGESEAAHRYRANRDAAHVDGLMRHGPERRRRLGERHAWLLGLPLGGNAPGAAPFVVWEGSHEVMRAAFAQALAGAPPERWGEVDLTDAYHAARRRCFETLRRVEVSAPPGAAWAVHRLALHGVAPWTAADDAPPRAVAYFRPEIPDGGDGWLAAS